MSDHHTLIKQLAWAPLLILQRLLDSEQLAPVVEALSLVAMALSTQKAVQVCPCALFLSALSGVLSCCTILKRLTSERLIIHNAGGPADCRPTREPQT